MGMVPPTVFVPRPKVDSALVRLDAGGPRRRSTVPSEPTRCSRLVRAGFAQRRKMLRRSLRPVLGDRTHRRARRARGSRPPPGPRRSGSTSGPPCARGAADRGGCVRLARVRATAYPKLTLSLRVLGRARRRLPRPRGARGVARPAARRARGLRGARTRRRAGGGRAAPSAADDVPGRPPQPRVHRGREADGARGSVRPRRAARPAQAHPRGRGTRRRFGRRRGRAARGAASCSTSTSTTPACSRSRPRSAPTCRSACAAARRGCGARRGDRAGVAADGPRRSCVAIPPFRLSTPDVYRAWDELGGPRAERVGARAAAHSAQILRELAQRPRAGGRGGRAAACVEFRTALEARRPARPALLAGSGSAYVVPVADARRSRRSSRRSAAACACRSSGRRACPAACGSSAERTGRDVDAGRDQPGLLSPSRARARLRSAALLATLPARALQKLLVLLLPHALAALLDQ